LVAASSRRYQGHEPDMKVVSYPAIAEQDERWDGKRLLRRKGQALFPALKPLDFLLERKKLMTEASWQSEYQQHPIVIGRHRSARLDAAIPGRADADVADLNPAQQAGK
jgi:hypothetical protein